MATLAIAAVLATAGWQPANAGFFDFLFGRRDPPPQQPVFRPVFRLDPEVARRNRSAIRARAAAKTRMASLGKAGDAETPGQIEAARNLSSTRTFADMVKQRGYRGAFAIDPTLRPGDVVVTGTGLEVFEGHRGGAHAMRDFKPLSLSSLRSRAELVKLQLRATGSGLPAAPEPAGGMPLTIRRAATAPAVTPTPLVEAPALQDMTSCSPCEPAIRQIPTGTAIEAR